MVLESKDSWALVAAGGKPLGFAIHVAPMR
jgi:hypothetical protein